MLVGGLNTRKDFAPITLTARASNVVAVQPSLAVRSVKEWIALAKARPDALSYATSGVGSKSHLTAARFASMADIRMEHTPYKGGAQATTDLLAGQVPSGVAPIASALTHITVAMLKEQGIEPAHCAPDEFAAAIKSDVQKWENVITDAGIPQESRRRHRNVAHVPAICVRIDGSLARDGLRSFDPFNRFCFKPKSTLARSYGTASPSGAQHGQTAQTRLRFRP